MSHAAGVRDILDEETVRAIMALRIKDLARGHSGIRLETVHRLIEFLNRNICPIVPEKGSVGADCSRTPGSRPGFHLLSHFRQPSQQALHGLFTWSARGVGERNCRSTGGRIVARTDFTC